MIVPMEGGVLDSSVDPNQPMVFTLREENGTHSLVRVRPLQRAELRGPSGHPRQNVDDHDEMSNELGARSDKLARSVVK
jgi:hypothetical protein